MSLRYSTIPPEMFRNRTKAAGVFLFTDRVRKTAAVLALDRLMPASTLHRDSGAPGDDATSAPGGRRIDLRLEAWLVNLTSHGIVPRIQCTCSTARNADQMCVTGLVWSGRPGGLPSEAPTDPDVQISRIRLFGPRFRYAMVAGRTRGSGNG